MTQRLWWSVLLTAGLLATYALLTALGVRGPTARVLGALAYTLSPRVLSTVGGLSSEALPVLLAPAILLPVVLCDAGADRATPGGRAVRPRGAVLRRCERHGHDPRGACRPGCGC